METGIKKLLVANRGEIAIRVFRACTEVGIRTVAIYSYEDRFSLHRFKADEAYQIGEAGNPVAVYLDIESVVALAKRVGADAVHPGYGFLSERAEFSAALETAGITFVGPTTETLRIAGDKTETLDFARSCGVPTIPGSDALSGIDAAAKEAKQIGYPLMLKASFGGGGRGIRKVENAEQLKGEYESAVSESRAAFGREEVFLEKHIAEAKHIEVQLLGDGQGAEVHLFERDCSIQRRNQKVCEFAPAIAIDQGVLERLYEYGLKLAAGLQLRAAATAEFLVTNGGSAADANIYFIEINPRIQVEHTVTEEYTGIDLVQSQLRIAAGRSLSDLKLSQKSIQGRGFALQCRVTTEDPGADFSPDYGRLIAYRSAAGSGIRLDAGSAFTGSEILPFYDSMLVKITARGEDIHAARARMRRALSEFRIRGVKTNIPFLENLLDHDSFTSGEATTSFLSRTPEIFSFRPKRNRANRLLRYLSEQFQRSSEAEPVSGARSQNTVRLSKVLAQLNSREASAPEPDSISTSSWKTRYEKMDREAFFASLLEEKRLLICDTTFRDAHQSLLATRMRTADMLPVASALSERIPELFSLEMWGGATFDVMLRYLREDPWERVRSLRKKIPNLLFQMLLRGENGVGYKSYPKSLIREFIFESKSAGIDVFRVFDAFNSVERVSDALKQVRECGGIAEAAICYTGDLSAAERSKHGGGSSKFNLQYYRNLAAALVDAGADMLAIKDMAGLLRVDAAQMLVEELKSSCSLPVHLHTHDTAGAQTASYLRAASAGVDIVDCAFSAMAGLTSQPSMEALVAHLAGSERDTGLDLGELNLFSRYWEEVRESYAGFESGLKAPTAEVYLNEMPGGQYSNLRPQAAAVGLAERWNELKDTYTEVDALLGKIVKVTPSSKVVGDLAIHLLLNNLSTEEFAAEPHSHDLPQSVLDFFAGRIGEPYGGFPEDLREKVMASNDIATDIESEDEVDLEAAATTAAEMLGGHCSRSNAISYLLYPKVFEQYAASRRDYGDLTSLPTNVFFGGLEIGQEIAVDLEPGKRLYISLEAVQEQKDAGVVTFFYELNGQPRQIEIASSGAESGPNASKADPDDPSQIASPLSGALVERHVAVGDPVTEDQPLFTIEAMKMQTVVRSRVSGKVAQWNSAAGATVAAGDFVLSLNIK